ncbi:hypothetical protein GSH05_34005 [Burkholderia pseudomallei]|nr:hypothetical protein [Burkholderia pseudomallei]PNW89108.1 hypothetical protein CF640_37945 [Burkholderia pseudomallei]PNX01369.1 hypothetical protein CF645_38790 [Burkholderia pseudomallei]
MDSGSVVEMDVEAIRVVIVSMYLKMIRTSLFGSNWNTAQRENSTCNVLCIGSS